MDPNAFAENYFEDESQNIAHFLYDTFEALDQEGLESAAGDRGAHRMEMDDRNLNNPDVEQQSPFIRMLRLRLGNRLLVPYICNLCLDYVRGGVITICGHLFCWTCLWAELHNLAIPRCPRCKRRLILHEDILPFLGEGPNAGPDDENIVAQPCDVPRPSGLYLEDQQYPIWFAVHAFEQLPFVDNRGERNFPVIVQRMQMEYEQPMQWIKYLQWFQSACVLIILYVWMYTMSFSD